MPELEFSNKQLVKELEEVGKELSEYLKENYNPHITAIVTSTDIELVEGIMMGKFIGELKTSEDWSKLCNVTVLDPDGWDRKNFQDSWYEEKITREEFENRLWKSTVSNVAISDKELWRDKND